MSEGNGSATHAYCEICDGIEMITWEPLDLKSYDGVYLGGDIVCNRCRVVVATVYKVRK